MRVSNDNGTIEQVEAHTIKNFNVIGMERSADGLSIIAVIFGCSDCGWSSAVLMTLEQAENLAGHLIAAVRTARKEPLQ